MHDYKHTSTGGRERPSFSLNPILLSRRNSGGGDGNLGDGRSELVLIRFCGLVRIGRGLAWWTLVVWRKGSRSRGWNGAFSRHHRLGPSVQLHRDQLPNPTRLEAAVVLELYLGFGISVAPYKCFRGTDTDWCTIFLGSMIPEVPDPVARTPEKAETMLVTDSKPI